MDKVLQRLSHGSQVALLGLGVFGYFYTVLPVFQNQQLQEQAARLELEKAQAQRQLDALTREQGLVQTEIARLRESWAQERSLSSQMSREAQTAREDERSARLRGAEAESALAKQLELLDRARWELVLNDFSLAHTMARINSFIRTAPVDNKQEPSQFLVDETSSWPDPFASLISALDVAQRKRTGAESMPKEYYSELRSFIEQRRSRLTCQKPDVQAMIASFQVQSSALLPLIEKEVEASVERVRAEHMAKGQRVHITDEYRQSLRNSIRVSREFSLKSSFRGRVTSMRAECDGKALDIIQELFSSKGLRS